MDPEGTLRQEGAIPLAPVSAYSGVSQGSVTGFGGTHHGLQYIPQSHLIAADTTL